MPNVKMPDGTMVRFPDDMPPERIRQLIEQKFPQAKSDQSAAVLPDVLKSGGRGLLEGAAAIPGLPGDLIDFTRAAGGWLGNQARRLTGKEPLPGPAPDPLGLSRIPGTADIVGGIDTATSGKLQYEPQTTAGKYARTAGQFVPAVAALGGIGEGVRAATGAAVKYGVVPGLASEAAGQATEGTPYEPYARAGTAIGSAALAGGATATGRWLATPKEPAINAIADRATKLKEAASTLYRVVDQSGIQVSPLSIQAGVVRIKAVLRQKGYEPGLAPAETERALKIIDNLANEPATFRRLDAARQAVKDAFTYTNPAEARLATILTKEFDGFVSSLKPADIVSGASPRMTARALTQARALWGRSAALNDKAYILDNIWQKALDKVGANYSKAGIQTALRQEFRALNSRIRTNEEIGRLFSKNEKAIINEIVRGGRVENLLRNVGKLAPVSPSAAGFANLATAPPAAAAGFLYTGTPTGAVVGGLVPTAVGIGAGIPARTAANIMQRRNIDRLIGTVLNEGVTPAFKQPSRLSPAMLSFYASRPPMGFPPVTEPKPQSTY